MQKFGVDVLEKAIGGIRLCLDPLLSSSTSKPGLTRRVSHTEQLKGLQSQIDVLDSRDTQGESREGVAEAYPRASSHCSRKQQAVWQSCLCISGSAHFHASLSLVA
jgi:hypothetical protein